MTEEQKKRKAERDKKYRENKKLKAALDAIGPVPVPDCPQTDFDVLMRRMRRESAR